MKENIWEKESYYKVIESTHSDEVIEKDPIFLETVDIIKNIESSSILDMGCGEGWFIEKISKKINKNNSFVGVDVSNIGIKNAKERKIDNAIFVNYDGKILPFPNKEFDVSVSNFVFEHLSDPLETFNEMSRVTKTDGLIIIACPNFGSPLFKSPCNKQSKIKLMIIRFLAELTPSFFFKKNLHWEKVSPIPLPENIHIPDYDTLCEPSLSFFEKFLKNNKKEYSIVKIDSMWKTYNYEEILNNKKSSALKKKLINFAKFLGLNNLLRFQYFGSFFFVAIRKK